MSFENCLPSLSALAVAALCAVGCDTEVDDPGSPDASSALDSAVADAAPVPRDGASDAGKTAAAQAAADAAPGDAEAGQLLDAGDAGTPDAGSPARALDGFFLDVPCDSATPVPLANGATCLHPGATQHLERVLDITGDTAAHYDVVLRVRGIWEPTKIEGGQRPDGKRPFTIGGALPAGTGSSDAISYQQYALRVSSPAQVYWLNDYQYLAHDIHKEDYEATIRVAGGAQVTVVMNDGNDHQIANWTKDFFAGLAPYDHTPSTGQSLHLDVVSVTPVP